MKPGFKTSEFWLTAASQIVALVYMSGVLDETATPLDNKLFALVAALLGSLGYTVARAYTKAVEVKAIGEAAKVAPLSGPTMTSALPPQG